MRRLAIAAATALLIPTIAAAQQKPIFEIGSYAGVSFQRLDINGSKDTYTSIDVPQLGIFASFFAANRLMIEPELAFINASGGGVTGTGFELLTSLGYAFSGVSGNSFYVAPGGAIGYTRVSGDDVETDTETDYAAGLRAGYRVVIRDALALRFEGGYFRQFPEIGDDANLFMLRIGIGGVLNSGAPRTASR